MNNEGSPGTEPSEGFWASVKRLGRGDVGALARRIERHIKRAEASAAERGLMGGRHDALHDVGVIAGISVTMLGIKALKILPSIPFAPGHKLVLLTPLYIIASQSTRSRFGGTFTGLSMGVVAFLMGDGKYGVFEILKHIAPGLMCDALLPLMARMNRTPGPVLWSTLGGVLAAGRFVTIIAIVAAVQAPTVAWAMFAPGLVVHMIFGVMSGYVSYHLVMAIPARSRRAPPDVEVLAEPHVPAEPAATKEHT